MLRWEIDTRRETILDRFSSTSTGIGLVSPDERWLVRSTHWPQLEIRRSSGGEWKPLVSLSKDFGTGHIGFTPDGNWLLYHDIDSAGKHSLFRIATAGGPPERLGDFPTDSRTCTMEISPDGRKVLVAADESANRYELWSLENFVPHTPITISALISPRRRRKPDERDGRKG